MPRAYAPHLKTIWLVNDLQRIVAPAKVRLLPTSARTTRRVRIEGTDGTVQNLTFAEARQIVEATK